MEASKFFLPWVTRREFTKGILIALQKQTDESGNLIPVDSSACLTTFDALADQLVTMNLNDVIAAKAAYELHRKNKGQAGANNTGFWINFLGTY